MLNSLIQSLESYEDAWRAFVAAHKDVSFLEPLEPTAAAWKTEDLADFDKRFLELRELSDQIHLGWVNDRWLATFHLRDSMLPWEIRLVKLMQRRPGSRDKIGLDHVDFRLQEGLDPTRKRLIAAPEIRWTEEKNGEYCTWLSIWFSDTEAKLRADTVLDVCIAELKECQP